MNLLIIDDSRKMRELLRKMFEKKFENIYECEDGSEALDAYRRYLPSYVFMDVEMKLLDGIKATTELKSKFPDARIIIVAFTMTG
jgi:CheY-like chemotaxis protein